MIEPILIAIVVMFAGGASFAAGWWITDYVFTHWRTWYAGWAAEMKPKSKPITLRPPTLQPEPSSSTQPQRRVVDWRDDSPGGEA